MPFGREWRASSQKETVVRFVSPSIDPLPMAHHLVVRQIGSLRSELRVDWVYG